MRTYCVLVLLGLTAALVMAEEEITNSQEEEDKLFKEDSDNTRKGRFRGRTFEEMSKTFWSWFGYDYDDYEDYDYQYFPASSQPNIGYGLPAIGYIPASAGVAQSSYSSYIPVHHQFAHTRDDNFAEDEDDWSMSDLMFDMAVAIVPIGILLAALPSGLFTIAVRRRSFDDSNLLMDSLEPQQVNRIISLLKSDLTDRNCQEELFCELSNIGEQDEASLLQKAFYYISTLTPDVVSARIGMGHLFRITRSGYCKALQCSSTSILEPPKLVHQPTDTNQLTVVETDAEQEASELSKE